jgi:hypothetical protein
MLRSVNADTNMDTGFDAKLKGVTLADLIQMKCLSGASECFRINSGQKTGTLYFFKGAITHATAGDLLGDKAVLELLGWTTGTFEPAATAPPADSSVLRSWQNLLLDAAQIRDERSRYVPLLSQSRESGVRPSLLAPKESPMKTLARPLTAVAPAAVAEVRLDPSGRVVNGKSEYEELTAATAYVLHVAGHIGLNLGLDPFKGGEFKSGDLRTTISVEDNGEVTAVQSKCEADVIGVRGRAGL